MAGGPHRPRHRPGGRGRNPPDAGRVRHVCRRVPGFAGGAGGEDPQRAVRRGRGHLLHRRHDAGRQGPAGGHLPLSRPELRQSLRREIRHQRRRAGIRVGYLLGREHPPDGRPYHGPLRRRGPGAAPQAGPDPGGDRAYLQERGAAAGDLGEGAAA